MPGGPGAPERGDGAVSAPAPTELPPAPDGLSRVIVLGDSVAAGQALALGAALGSADVELHSAASTGGGGVVGPVADQTWAEVPDLIASAKPSTVIYQVTTYDWGTPEEQRAGYERLAEEVAAVDALLVLVSMPPIEPDEFYAPHMTELEAAQEAARAVAEASDGRAVFLDAGEVWGETFERTVDGETDRSSDGIHTCPQGAARWTVWLLDELAAQYPDFTPPAPREWAAAAWADGEEFVGC